MNNGHCVNRQPFGDHRRSGSTHVCPAYTRLRGPLGCRLCVANDLVHLPLLRRERAAHREGASNVGRISTERRGGVDQQQIAGPHIAVIAVVVQHGAVRAGADDGGIRRTVSAISTERVFEQGLDLELVHARFQHARRFGVRLHADGSGALDQVHLGRAFLRTHRGYEVVCIRNLKARVLATQLIDEAMVVVERVPTFGDVGVEREPR